MDKLFLAPHFAEFADANLAYLLALRADSKGNLYAAGGSNAKVLRLDASGKATTVFESSELAAQALAVDAAGNLFVARLLTGKFTRSRRRDNPPFSSNPKRNTFGI